MTTPIFSKPRVLVAMSGGVDSSVAAYLLKKEGYEVIGATIKTWASGDKCRTTASRGCCSILDIDDARQTAAQLNIPYYVWDMASDFESEVIDYFTQSYLEAKTPNPCVVCNNKIKFGTFMQKALELNAEFIATGHYARRQWHEADARWVLAEGVDAHKDQSYVLAGLTREQIARTLLPVGDYRKDQIRSLAREMGLRVHDKPDSQEICFVDSHYSRFIESRGLKMPGEGDIVDRQGRVLGRHPGFPFFTIGQRKGLGPSIHEPFYVTAIDPSANRIVIGPEEDLYCPEVRIEKFNWILEPREAAYELKIRSRNEKAAGQVRLGDNGSVHFTYDKPQKSVTPGQLAVLYDGPYVAGGGWIKNSEHKTGKSEYNIRTFEAA